MELNIIAICFVVCSETFGGKKNNNHKNYNKAFAIDIQLQWGNQSLQILPGWNTWTFFFATSVLNAS
jgi:hypothetical protein